MSPPGARRPGSTGPTLGAQLRAGVVLGGVLLGGCSSPPVPEVHRAHLAPRAALGPEQPPEPVRGTLVRGPDGAYLLWCEDPLWGEGDGVRASIRDPRRTEPNLLLRVEDDVVWVGYPRQAGTFLAIDHERRIRPITPEALADLEAAEQSGDWERWD